MRYEIRLSGEGGQGIILAGVILAEAAVLYDNKNAVQSQSYGPEARGGASKCDVVISDGDIDYPKATNIDTLLALTEEAYHKYSSDLKENGILIVDSYRVKGELPKRNLKVYKIPFTEIAKEKIGKLFVMNVVALGAMVEITKAVSLDAVKNALLNRVPKGTEELNKKALEIGIEEAKKIV
jgi:2-oxoglutarate ferredoxin oxidoreductase subunit gamma